MIISGRYEEDCQVRNGPACELALEGSRCLTGNAGGGGGHTQACYTQHSTHCWHLRACSGKTHWLQVGGRTWQNILNQSVTTRERCSRHAIPTRYSNISTETIIEKHFAKPWQRMFTICGRLREASRMTRKYFSRSRRLPSNLNPLYRNTGNKM